MPATKKASKPTYQPVLKLPPLAYEDFVALRDNIAINGVLVPILVDSRGPRRKIIDGSYRKAIADELGYECPEIVEEGLTEDEKRTLARALNLARRQFSTDQKRELIADQLRETPERSNRWIGKQLGVSHPTVASVRGELETTGKVFQFERTIGEDGKARPAAMPRDGITGHERPYRGNTNDWLTPKYVLDALGKFDLDPCASLEQPWRTAKRQFTILEDGLKQDWFGRVWLNPPYGEQTARWLAKMARHGNGIVLIFARTETKMFFDHIWENADGIFFLKGRISFYLPGDTPDGEAGAPSALVSYDRRGSRFNQNVLKNCALKGKFLEIK